MILRLERKARPDADLDPAMRALHADISDRQAKIPDRGDGADHLLTVGGRLRSRSEAELATLG